MVDENRETRDRNNQELHSEAVVVAIVCCLELHVDQIDCGISTADVDHLHACVVKRDEGGEEIQVASGEDQSKQDLAFSRDTCTRPALPYFEQQDDDSSKMRQVSGESEHVHRYEAERNQRPRLVVDGK